jgi:hypothetical protein
MEWANRAPSDVHARCDICKGFPSTGGAPVVRELERRERRSALGLVREVEIEV